MKVSVPVVVRDLEATAVIFDDGDIFDIEEVEIDGFSVISLLLSEDFDSISEQYYSWAFSQNEEALLDEGY